MVTLKWSLVFDKMTSLLQGCAVTMEISVLTLIFGTILGVVLALMRDSHIKVVSRLAQLYIWIWRGTPLMVQAFLIYFGLPNLGITFSAMTAGVLSMSLNTGAYIAEIVRSGIHAIDPGQRSSQSTWNALASGNASNCGTTGNQDLHSSSCKPVYCHHQKYLYFVRHHFDRADKRGNPDRL